MCKTCGCSGDAHNHSHHDHPHGAGRGHDHRHGERTRVERAILDRNDRQAEHNRGWLAERGVLVLNLLSSPGAGKTALLERTVRDLGRDYPLQVIEGDQQTDLDTRRIEAAGCRAVQINTGTGCHLDAAMVAGGFARLDPPSGSIVFIENVGNLVCPALFDLGERAKVVIASVTEGDDKPLKYPHMFRAADLLLLNKIDLLPHVSFDRERFGDSVRQVHPGLRLVLVSALRGDGLPEWYDWVREQAARLGPAIDEGAREARHG